MPAYTADDFTPSRSVGYLVKRVHQDVVASVEPLFADAELSFTQWTALVSIHFGTGSTCAALSRDIGHDMGATSRMIASLEERGLLTRERSEGDRRIVHLSLTPLGVELATVHRERLIEHWNLWLSDWSKEEVEVLIGGLQRLRRTMETVREAGE